MIMVWNDCYMFAIKYGNYYDYGMIAICLQFKYWNDYDIELIAICLQLNLEMIMILKWLQYVCH